MFSRFRSGSRETSDDEDEAETSGYSRLREAELLAAIDQLPSLPVVVQRLLGSMGDQRSDAHELEELISQDMVIAGKVLKLVNSPFYMLPNKVSSLQQAVAILGQRSLRSLVVAVSTTDILSVDLTAYGFTEKGLWFNSMATAGIARRLAELVRLPREEADECFVAGLLRDVGMLVLGPVLAQNQVVLPRMQSGGPRLDIIDRERTAVRFDHCWIGERVADKWDLSASLRLAISKHHRILSDWPPEIIQRLAITRLAERLAYTAKVGVVDDHPFDTSIDGGLLKAAGVEQDHLKIILGEIPQVVAAAKQEV